MFALWKTQKPGGCKLGRMVSSWSMEHLYSQSQNIAKIPAAQVRKRFSYNQSALNMLITDNTHKSRALGTLTPACVCTRQSAGSTHLHGVQGLLLLNSCGSICWSVAPGTGPLGLFILSVDLTLCSLSGFSQQEKCFKETLVSASKVEK